MMNKKLNLFLSFLLLFILVSCNPLTNDSPIHLSSEEYIPNTQGYQISSIIDINTKSTTENQKSENLLYIPENEIITATYGRSSDKENSSAVLMNVYYDYQKIDFKLEGEDEYISEYNFNLDNNTQLDISFSLDNKSIDIDNNIHKLLVTFTTGYHQNASDFEITTNEYGLNIIFDVVHELNHLSTISSIPTDYILPENNFEKNYENILLNTDYENTTQNSEFGGISLPLNELKTTPDTILPLMYNISKNYANEALLLLTLNYNLIDINDSSTQLIKLDGADGTANGTIQIKTPSTPGKYELIGYVILNPFEKISTPSNLVYSSYRFTLIVE